MLRLGGAPKTRWAVINSCRHSQCSSRAPMSASSRPTSQCSGGMDNALGALLGVAVGDAAGAPLEGAAMLGRIAPERALQCMHMEAFLPGLLLTLGRGQVTDDTELTISLARGLVGHPPSAGFPAESVARAYNFWYYDGEAFGGGNTCMTAFSVPLEPDRVKWVDGSVPSLAQRMEARAQQKCVGSKANGALMRASPVAVWAHKLPPAAVAELAAADARLSHPNKTCADCSAAYCIVIAHLISHPGDAGGALQAACAWVAEHAGEEVRGWLRHDSTQPLDSLDCRHLAGFVRHAFVLAFHHLRASTPFTDAIQQTLCCGGDTDTNAAIVGGMMGALHGSSAIPSWMSTPVLEFEGREDQGGGTPRPRELRVGQLPALAKELFELAGS